MLENVQGIVDLCKGVNEFLVHFGDTNWRRKLVCCVLLKGGKVYETAYPKVPILRLHKVRSRLSESRGPNHHPA